MKKNISIYIDLLDSKIEDANKSLDLFFRMFIVDHCNDDVTKYKEIFDDLKEHIEHKRVITNEFNIITEIFTYFIDNNINKDNSSKIQSLFNCVLSIVKLQYTYDKIKSDLSDSDITELTEREFDTIGINSLKFVESIFSKRIVNYYDQIPGLYSLLEQESKVETIDSILNSINS